jgi:hypothetical protein
MPHSTKAKKDEVITPRKSVHVVYYSCPNCQEEIEEVKICACGEPMKVINVVEKFGDEAQKYIGNGKKNGNGEEEEKEDFVGTEKEEPNIILMDENANLNDEGIDPNKDDDMGLDVIFPDDDHDDATPKAELPADDELSKALEQLDSEEEDVTADDFGFEGEDIPEL